MKHNFEQLLGDIEACRFCFMCVPACEVANHTRMDANTPRGIALTLFRVHSGTQQFDQRVSEILYQCSSCGACKDWCISHFDVPGYVEAARVDAVRLGLAPSAPAACGMVDLDGGDGPVYWGACGTCDTELQDASVGLLRRAGLHARVAGGDSPCLGELRNLGYLDQAREVARQAVDTLQAAGASEVVVPCPDCLSVLAAEAPAGIRFVGLTDRLVELVEHGRVALDGQGGLPQPVVYYAGGGFADPESPGRRLLQASGASLAELKPRGPLVPEAGAGGGLPRTNPGLARALADKVLQNAVEAGAVVLVSDDPKVVAHLRGCNRPLAVLHLAQLLAAAATGEGVR